MTLDEIRKTIQDEFAKESQIVGIIDVSLKGVEPNPVMVEVTCGVPARERSVVVSHSGNKFDDWKFFASEYVRSAKVQFTKNVELTELECVEFGVGDDGILNEKWRRFLAGEG